MTGLGDGGYDAGGRLVRVLLVDDDALVRAGLRLILGGAPDLVVVGEAGDGYAAVDAVLAHHPDLVLMDVRMPRRDGLAATRDLLARPNPPRILVLTTFDTDELVLAALRAGAHGFLLKDTPPERMVDAVRAVAAGETTLSPSVVRQVVAVATGSDHDVRRRRAAARLATLTDREREVALGIGRGCSNAQIAQELTMSVATVKAHLGHVFAKLDAANRVQVAITVHDAGLT